jgi:hypothetical protein
MKFVVTTTSSGRLKSNYRPILENFNLETQTVICDWDDKLNGEIYRITINTIEELIDLKNQLKCELIITNEFEDDLYMPHEELTIEIYDGCRE